MRTSVAAPRFRTVVLTTFAALAALLALLGLYGVIAHSVSDRTHEMGVRMALGADYGQILAMVLRSGLGLALAGVALGTAAAVGLTRFLGGMLFAVTPADPLTFVVVAATLAGAAALACVVPARRATRADPRQSLRCE